MKENYSKSLYIRVIEFASKHPEGFKYEDIINNQELNLQDWEKNIIDRHFYNACQRYHHNNNTIGETIFQFIEGQSGNHKSTDNRYILAFDAEFTFFDYQELKLATKNAKDAKAMSLVAIMISVLAIIISAWVPFLVASRIQSVKIDDNQLKGIINEVKNSITTLTNVEK